MPLPALNIAPTTEKPKCFSIKQSNSLTRAIYGFSSMGKNVLYILQTKIFKSNEQEEKYEISCQDFAKIGKKVNKKDLVDVVRALSEQEILLPSGEKITLLSNTHEQFDGGVSVQIAPEARFLFFDLEQQFTVFDPRFALSLKSKYAKRLYEMLCQFRSTGKIRIPISALKKILDVELKSSTTFWRDAIKKPLNELQEKGGINVLISKRKRGRELMGLDITFNRFPVHLSQLPEEKRENNDKKAPEKQYKRVPWTKDQINNYASLMDLGFTNNKKFAQRIVCRIPEMKLLSEIRLFKAQLKEEKSLNPHKYFGRLESSLAKAKQLKIGSTIGISPPGSSPPCSWKRWEQLMNTIGVLDVGLERFLRMKITLSKAVENSSGKIHLQLQCKEAAMQEMEENSSWQQLFKNSCKAVYGDFYLSYTCPKDQPPTPVKEEIVDSAITEKEANELLVTLTQTLSVK